MKLDQDPRTFESNTVNGTSAFTIAASSKAFQILSNQLYTDKPRAILRELSTNALDAHIAAGKAHIPFEVQLPTTWDSTLIVKDFGTGMSPEAIKSLYTTYFGSDKTHTNDLVGGLGLGSKSPFAYTDQFTTISRYNGVKYTYAAFISEANVPEISLVAQEDTDEENGFEVHVPVKDSDIYTFERTAKRVFEFFDVKPILNQSIDFTVYDESVMTMEYNGIECSLYSNQDDTIVMQGPIGYPVDPYAVMNDLDYKKRNKVEVFLSKGWRIKAPVGTFEITASRESLSYNKKTIAKLLETAHEILQQVKNQAEEKLKDTDSLNNAAELIIASTKYLPGSLSLEGAAWNGLTWDGHGFEVDLPPGTRCREIRKRQYGRGSDPHQTDIHIDQLALRAHDYRVYWSEKDRPFKHFIGENPVEGKNERILYFTGPLGNLKSWLASIGLPAGNEMPKPSKVGGPCVARKVNYGATKYNGRCLTTGVGLSAIANDIVDEQNAYILMTCGSGNLYHYEEEFEILQKLDAVGDIDEDIYVFYVPDHHSKVRKAIESHPGFINRELLLDLCKPKDEIMRKIALTEALTESHKAVAQYQNLDIAVDVDRLEDETLISFIEKLEAIKKAQHGNHNIWAIKNRLAHYPLNFDDTRYTDQVAKLVRGQTHELRSIYNEFQTVIDPVIKAYESCGHWRYRDSALQTIVTEWLNTQVDYLSSPLTQEVA